MNKLRPLIPPLLVLPLLLLRAAPARTVTVPDVDSFNVLSFGGSLEEKASQFGTSTVLLKNGDKHWALFGAPQWSQDHQGGGAVFACSLDEDSECQPFLKGRSITMNVGGRVKVPVRGENQSFGLAMAYDYQNSKVVVCSPRGSLEWTNEVNGSKDLHFFTTGFCSWYDQDFRPALLWYAKSELRQPIDFTDSDKSKVFYHSNSMRELGFSISIRNGKYVFGAPGYQDWSGKAVHLESYQAAYPYSTTPVKMTDNADYAGYSVAQMVIGKQEYVVLGAPRRNNVKGEVIIAVHEATPNTKGTVFLSGDQTGEYFGAAVAVADVNGDGFDDLLVGAPFYSPTEEGTFDRGLVYLFLGTETKLDRYPKLLHPAEGSSQGRFGAVITRLGDLNKDGCDDIAIGAPFEARDKEQGSGAVYIFYGSAKHGLSNDERTRITPSRWNVRGFGYSISEGLDVTNNGYLDFSVGAALSGHGFIYKTPPLIHLDASMTGNLKPIPVEGGSCGNGQMNDLACFDLDVCFGYTLPKADNSPVRRLKPKPVIVDIRIVADHGENATRAFVGKKGQLALQNLSLSVTMKKPDEKNCATVTAFVMPNRSGSNILKPIEFRMTYDMFNPAATSGFCADCPLFSSKSPISALVYYQANCKHAGCLVNLKLNAHIEGLANGDPITLGRKEPLILQIHVESEASSDIAFRTQVVIRLKSGLTFNNAAKCANSTEEGGIACSIDDELKAGSKRTLTVKLQLDHQMDIGNGERPTAELNVELQTASINQNKQATSLNLSYPLEVRADAGISGQGLVEHVIFSQNTSAVTIDHVYSVTKYYDSMLDAVELLVVVPVFRKADRRWRHPFVKVYPPEVKTSDSSVKIECYSQAQSRPARDVSEAPKRFLATMPTVRQVTIDCESFSCRRYRCSMGPFLADQMKATFHLQIKLNITEFIEQAHVIPEQIVYRSHGSIMLQNRQALKVEPAPKSKAHSINTVLVREGKPFGRGIEWWWLLLAVLIGLNVVTVMFYVLHKCGFFKRGTREHLDQLQKEPHSATPILSSHHSPINNMVDVDDNENSSTFLDSKV